MGTETQKQREKERKKGRELLRGRCNLNKGGILRGAVNLAKGVLCAQWKSNTWWTHDKEDGHLDDSVEGMHWDDPHSRHLRGGTCGPWGCLQPPPSHLWSCDLQKNVNSTRGTECPLLVYTFSSLVPVPWVSRLLLSLLSPHVPLFATAWTVAAQAPLSMRFPRQDYWGG